MQQTCYSLWLAYSFRFDNIYFESIFLFVNAVFYTMEMKFVICKNLHMIVGEIGPVEFELFLSTLIWSVAFFCGVEVYQDTIDSHINIDPAGYFAFFIGVQWKFVAGCIFLPLLILFLHDNLGDCFATSFKSSMYYLLPIISVFSMGYTS